MNPGRNQPWEPDGFPLASQVHIHVSDISRYGFVSKYVLVNNSFRSFPYINLDFIACARLRTANKKIILKLWPFLRINAA